VTEVVRVEPASDRGRPALLPSIHLTKVIPKTTGDIGEAKTGVPDPLSLQRNCGKKLPPQQSKTLGRANWNGLAVVSACM